MPTVHSINLQSQLHAISLIDLGRESIRAVAEVVGVPKSTLHDNLGKYRIEVAAFEQRHNNFERNLARDILSLSFEGKTSSRDCAVILSRMTGHDISHQKVLMVLKDVAQVARRKNSEKLPLRLVKDGEDIEVEPLTYVKSAAFDEIFQKQQPILGFVDPVSSFIHFEAADNRSGESWTLFLAQLRGLGLNPASVIIDGGQGAQKGLKEIMPEAMQFRDLFHVLQKLSKGLRALEGYCYRLMAAFYKAAAGEVNDNQSLIDLEAKMHKAITIYDALEKESKELRSACYFENHRDYVSSSQTEIIIKRIVGLISCGERNSIKHDALAAARTYLSGSCNQIVAYKKSIEEIVSRQFGTVNSPTVLGYICPIIEYLDQIQRSYENNKRRDYWVKKLIEARAEFRNLSFVDQREVDLVIDQVAKIMGDVKKSNSLIEAVNSVIRRYLVSYKSIPSWFCPIFNFYWNHRTFARGKRKNLKPREILTGKPFEKDWIDVLLDEYYSKSEKSIANEPSIKAQAA